MHVLDREEAPVGGNHPWHAMEDSRVVLDRRHEQRVIGLSHHADIGDDAAFGLLHFDHLTKLGRLVDLAAAKDARLRLEDADDLFLRLGDVMKDALLGLPHDASPQIEGAFQYTHASSHAA
jgi:hypothetical protein